MPVVSSEVPSPLTFLTNLATCSETFRIPSGLIVYQNETKNSGKYCNYEYSFIIRDQPKDETHRERSKKVLTVLSPGNQHVSSSQYINMFTNQASVSSDFTEISFCRHN